MTLMTWPTAISIVVPLWFALALVMSSAWWIEQRTANSGWVDVIWTIGLGLVSTVIIALLYAHGATSYERAALISALVLAWSARLGIHIAMRTRSVSDDPRYAHLRAGWGEAAGRNMFWLLQAQALLSIPLALSVILAALNPAPFITKLDILALMVFLAGLIGSAAADFQLHAFKKGAGNDGKVCDVGLWSWSRHPNYFFEWLVWLSYPLFAINLSGAFPWGHLALTGPVCMYWLLTRVSGIPPLEEHMLRKYRESYARYQKTTSPFFPIPPTSQEAKARQ